MIFRSSPCHSALGCDWPTWASCNRRPCNSSCGTSTVPWVRTGKESLPLPPGPIWPVVGKSKTVPRWCHVLPRRSRSYESAEESPSLMWGHLIREIWVMLRSLIFQVWPQMASAFMHLHALFMLLIFNGWCGVNFAMACYGGHVISPCWLVFAIPPHWKLKNGLRSNPSCQFLCQLCCTLHQFWPAISHPRAIVSKHAATQLGPQIGACPQMEPRCSGLWSVYVNLKALWWNDVEWFDSDDCWLLKPRRKVIEPDQAFLVDAGCCEGVGCKGTMVRNQLLLHGDPMEKTREPANWWTWNVVFVFSFVFQFLFWSFCAPKRVRGSSQGGWCDHATRSTSFVAPEGVTHSLKRSETLNVAKNMQSKSKQEEQKSFMNEYQEKPCGSEWS